MHNVDCVGSEKGHKMLFIVASGCIPIRDQGDKHVGIFVGTILAFRLSEISPRMRLGPHGHVYGIYGLVMGCHTHKEE